MTDIQKQMLATFLSLRIGIGVIGIAFPLLLWWGGGIRYHLPLADSMSAYYHATPSCVDIQLTIKGQCELDPPPATNPLCPSWNPCPPKPIPAGEGPMRNWFVGLLFAIGVGLYLIKGFSKQENVMLTIAGIFAVGVALFPMPWQHEKVKFSIHYLFALTFFILIALVVALCSGKTLKFMPPATPNRNKVIARYKFWYRFLAAAMVVFPLAAWGFGTLGRWDPATFAAEAAGIWSFGAYWLLKTKELSLSELEGRVLRGEIEMDTSTLR